MTDIRSVVVFGASGNIGSVMIPSLVAAGLDVTAITRGDKEFPSGVKVASADFESLDSLTSTLQNVDAVVSLVGMSALGHQTRLIDAAVAAKVKYFIPSEFGYDYTDPQVLPLLPVFSDKYAALKHLKAKEKEGLSWTMIVTALWFDWGLPLNMFDVDITNKKATLWDGGSIPFRATNVQDIATAVTRLLTEPNVRATATNTKVFISSLETTQNEILALAEKATGSKFEIATIDSDALIPPEEAKLQKGDLVAVSTVLKSISLSKKGLAKYGEKADEGNNLLLGDTESVKDVINKVIQGKGPQANFVV